MKEPVPVLQIVNQFAIGGAEGQFVARVRRHPRGFRGSVTRSTAALSSRSATPRAVGSSRASRTKAAGPST